MGISLTPKMTGASFTSSTTFAPAASNSSCVKILLGDF